MATKKRSTKKKIRVTSATARKKRTIARLRQEKVPVLASLPCVEDETQATLRSPDEVVNRAIAVLAVAVRGLHAPRSFLQRYARKFDLARKLSPDEKAFWKKAKPSARQMSAFSWRYEALRVLLWSLGFLPKLLKPSAQADPAKLGHVLFDRTENEFRSDAKLRPAKEILDFADLMYRYHWAVRDAQINDRPAPRGLNPDIVMEWDYAVRWLVGYADENWDDVTCDT